MKKSGYVKYSNQDFILITSSRKKMKLFIFAISLILTVSGLRNVEEWKKFKNNYGKTYSGPQEENLRYTIFMKNLQKIREHNEKFENGDTTFKLGVNQFADMAVEEFRKLLGYQKTTKPQSKETVTYFKSDSTSPLPKFVNWTATGAVTVVKDQGMCGSCWSFSAVGSLEGQYFRKTGKLISLSAQNLVDCDSTCAGCSGGLMDRAFEYIEKNGIETDKDYPYRGVDEPCAVNKTSTLIKISSYGYVRKNDESALQEAVATKGPISVAIDASDVFQLYSSGILDDKTCGNTEYDLDHGVLAVGYGTENGKDYWIVKNSWGSTWGENGYVRMSRNVKNQCGIATEPVYPIM